MPRLSDPDPELPILVSMKQARDAGLSADQVRQRVRGGHWSRVARGIYRTSTQDPLAPAWELDRRVHEARARAEVAAHPGAVLGFSSAAVVLELPLWRPAGHDVNLIAGPGGHNGRRRGVVIHRLELDECDISFEPVPRTSVARTWFDVTRTGQLADGLVLGDAALRAGLMSSEDVDRILDRALARRGVRIARAAARHLDPLRETPLESASWAYFLRHRIPLPRMQVELVDGGGRFLARVDFLWPDRGVVGECDGRLKYTDAQVLFDEKRREDAIRAEGYRVVRWTMEDLRTDLLATRIRRVHSWASQGTPM